MPTTRPLHVQNIWYDKIDSGEKRWEGRLNNANVKYIKVGDMIEFVSEHRQPLKLIVASILHFSDFEKMLEGEGLQLLLPGVSSMEEGLNIYRGFPGYREGEREFGAVVFRFREPSREDIKA
jgi:ASC-1-like (ASCH) protein